MIDEIFRLPMDEIKRGWRVLVIGGTRLLSMEVMADGFVGPYVLRVPPTSMPNFLSFPPAYSDVATRLEESK